MLDCLVRWKASVSATALYAAEALARGAARADDPLVMAVTGPGALLAAEIDLAGLPAERFWRRLLPLSADIEGNRQLAEAALTKTLGTCARVQTLAAPLAGRIADCESAAIEAVPGLVDELAARAEPLQAEWEARAEGLFASVARLTDQRVIAPSAQVVVVWPATGGPGTAFLENNLVLVEVASAGEQEGPLPRVVELVWLVAQLNMDLPIFSERIARDRQPRLAAVAMLPPVLGAAEEMGVAKCDNATVAHALAALGLPHDDNNAEAETLLSWWQTHLESRPPWHVALAALDQMLCGAGFQPASDKSPDNQPAVPSP